MKLKNSIFFLFIVTFINLNNLYSNSNGLEINQSFNLVRAEKRVTDSFLNERADQPEYSLEQEMWSELLISKDSRFLQVLSILEQLKEDFEENFREEDSSIKLEIEIETGVGWVKTRIGFNEDITKNEIHQDVLYSSYIKSSSQLEIRDRLEEIFEDTELTVSSSYIKEREQITLFIGNTKILEEINKEKNTQLENWRMFLL